ncbi:hypothetical protein ES703_36774 [subsurface metagenome]
MRAKAVTAVKYLKTLYQDKKRVTTKKQINSELTRSHGSGCPIIMLELQLRGYVKPTKGNYMITAKVQE